MNLEQNRVRIFRVQPAHQKISFGIRIYDPFEGFSYSVIMQYYGCVSVKDIITKSLDVLTIVVPPALPAKVQNSQ